MAAGLAGALFTSDLFSETFPRARAFRAGGTGPVRIRACVDLRLVRTGPEVRAAGGDLGTAVTGASEVGSVVAVAVIGLRVWSWRSFFAVEKCGSAKIDKHHWMMTYGSKP